MAAPGLPPREAAENLPRQRPQPIGRERIAEEAAGVPVSRVGRPVDHVAEPGREGVLGQVARKHFGARLAGLEDGFHGACVGRLGATVAIELGHEH